MTTSGVTTLNPTTYSLVKRALRMVGAYASNSNPRPEQVNDAVEVLNMMLKSWQTEGHLWLNEYCTLFLNKGQVVYNMASVSVNGFSHCVTQYNQTNLTSTALAGAGTVDVDTALINPTEYIGIANDNGIIEWFFAGNLTLTTCDLFSDIGLTAPAILSVNATSGNVVYSHAVSKQIDRPTRIFLASRKMYDATAAAGIEVPITLFSREEYQLMPNKTVQGKPVQAYYDPQLTAGKLYLWPSSDNAGDKLVLTVDRQIDIQTSDLNTFELPAEWMELVCYGLAERLWPEYPTSGSDYNMIAGRYASLKEAIMSYDRAPTSAFFQPNFRA